MIKEVGNYMTEEYAAKDDPAENLSLPQKCICGKKYLFIKQCCDSVLSLCAGLILLVPMAVIAVMIFVKDPGNPFYVQKRVGQNGKELHVWKFRSMCKGADRLEESLTPEQLAEYRREYKLKDDPRLLGYKESGSGKMCFGAVLRRFSLDELPQILFNVALFSNMSLVGPRPLLTEEIMTCYTQDERRIFISAKPGITGYWQVYGRNDATYESGERQRLELYYILNRSLLLDIRILFRTIGTVLKRKGAR